MIMDIAWGIVIGGIILVALAVVIFFIVAILSDQTSREGIWEFIKGVVTVVVGIPFLIWAIAQMAAH